ncbi:MAG TPA: S8 family serine peptidase [Candidatus Eisenbacteria bacterium]|jgi:hypothetical protein
MCALRLFPILLSFTVLAAPVRAADRLPLDLPVRYPDRSSGLAPAAPAYQGDVLEIQLAPRAAAAARLGARPRIRRLSLGVPGLDRIARDLGGVWFEPEFRGELPPPPGSGHPDFTSFYIAHLPRGLQLEDALAAFGGSAELAAAGPIAVLPVAAVCPPACPDDSLWSESYWYYQDSRLDIHAPEAWEVTTGDSAIVVAVLDTGVLPYHPDLGGTVAGLPGQIWTNWSEKAGLSGIDDDGITIPECLDCPAFVDDVHGWDFVNVDSLADEVRPGEDWRDCDNDPSDFEGHGTEVAGLVGALTNNGIGVAGTAWNLRIMPLRMGWAYARGGGVVRMDFAACAIRYATRMGAHVINCSWESVHELGLEAAVTDAVRNGVTVVVAAGNYNSANNYLVTRRDVISVAATNAQDKIAGFSSTGPDVDLAAPGVGISTTGVTAVFSDSVGLRQPDYARGVNGTSFSAPLVSGAVALLQARQRALGLRLLHPMAALLRLTETADDISALNPTLVGQYGSGRLDLARALSETGGSTAIGLGGQVVGAMVVLPSPTGGSPRMAVVTTNQRLLILDGATLDTLVESNLPGIPAGSLAAGDLGGGRGVGLFVGSFGSPQGWVAGLRSSGEPLPGWPQPGGGLGMVGGPALGDLDGDGLPEVVCGAGDGTLWAWHADGTPVGGFPITIATGSGVLPVALSDLDGLAGVEIVAATANGIVAAVRKDGRLLPGWPVALGGSPTAPALTGRGANREPVILIAANDRLHGLSWAGQEFADFSVPLNGSVSLGLDVALGDLDLDGEDEAVVATNNGVEARKLSGASLEPPWPRPLAVAPIVGSPVLGHLKGGAAPEVLVLRGAGLTGLTSLAESLATFPKPGGAGKFPTLVDLDGDGTTEVITGGPDPIFYVYDAGPGSFAATAQPWPTARGNFARTGSHLYDGSPQTATPPGGLQCTILGHPSRLPVTFRWSAALGQAGSPQVIRIYDVSGRRRAELSLGTGTEGLAQWNGRDENGNRARAGLYFVRFSSGSTHLDQRLVVIP